MQVSSRWRIVALVGAALFAGSIVGPPLAQAAGVGLVTIQGAGSTNKAAVTKAGQLTTTMAGARAAVVAFGSPSCSANGFYTIPAGKALIITGVDFYNHASGAGSSELDLLIGPSSSPCQRLVAAGIATDPHVSQNQSFQPGIPVPAGDSLGLSGINQSGTAEVYGYLVPSTAVGNVTAHPAPHLHPGQSATLATRH